MVRTDLQDSAERVLALMRAQGFEHAQVTMSLGVKDELNIDHNEPSLLRSTEVRKLALLGLSDGRKASAELTELGADAVRRRVAELYADATSAPQDDANAISTAQHARIVQGPQEGDPALLADKVGELLAFRERETPKMMIDQGAASNARVESHTLSSGGSDLACSVSWYEINVFGTARDGKQSSSFNYTGGTADDLRGRHAAEYFGIGAMLRATERQIHTQPIGTKFNGDVVLMPNAVADLLNWLLGQIGDVQLIAGSSLYRERVGRQIASSLLTLRSRFDVPGVAALSADGFVTPSVEILREGRLRTLTPSLYASRKTGLPHVPVAAAGWEVAAGETARSGFARRGVARCAGGPALDGHAGIERRLLRRHQEQLRHRRRRSHRRALRSDDQRQRRADAARRRGGEPRAHRQRRAAVALAAHRGPEFFLNATRARSCQGGRVVSVAGPTPPAARAAQRPEARRGPSSPCRRPPRRRGCRSAWRRCAA